MNKLGIESEYKHVLANIVRLRYVTTAMQPVPFRVVYDSREMQQRPPLKLNQSVRQVPNLGTGTVVLMSANHPAVQLVFPRHIECSRLSPCHDQCYLWCQTSQCIHTVLPTKASWDQKQPADNEQQTLPTGTGRTSIKCPQAERVPRQF